MIGRILAIVVCIVFSAFFSGSEIAYNTLNENRLKQHGKNKDGALTGAAAVACSIKEQFDRVLIALLVGNNLVNMGSSSLATRSATRAAIGTAETPAAPISGFSFSLLNAFISFAIRTPAAVAIENAARPRNKIPSVSLARNLSADSFDPTVRPMKIVTMLHKSFAAVFARRSTTLLSRSRLPNISIPIRGAALGTNRMQSRTTRNTKTIFSLRDTSRNCFILILRSSTVVSARMIGGWMIGTNAM